MEKYLKALVLIQESAMSPDGTNTPVNINHYLEGLRETKSNMLNNLSICATSVIIQEKKSENGLSQQIQPTIKQCLIKLATSSLTILSKIKVTSPQNIITRNTELFGKKNADYGNSFVDFGLIGIIVRLNDKINRILNLGNVEPQIMQVDEKVEDTINDLYNYCIIGLMYNL